MILLYKGRRGAGKTLSMVKDGYKYFKAGYKVYSNFKTTFSKYMDSEEVLELDKYSDIRNCVLMLDEAQIFFSSRQSMSKKNQKFSNFIQQIRKRNMILLVSTQFTHTVDIILREHTDIIATPKHFAQFGVCEIIYYDMTSIEDGIQNMLAEPLNVKIVFDATKIYPMYETLELIQ